MGWKCRIKYSFVVLEFRLSRRGCRASDRDALASFIQRFDRYADGDPDPFCHALLCAWNARDVDHVALATGLSGSLLCRIADFSRMPSSSADGANGRAFLHQLYLRTVLADRVGNRKPGNGRVAEPGDKSIEQCRFRSPEFLRWRLHLVDRRWLVGTVFKRRGAMVRDQGAFRGRAAADFVIQRRG